MDQPEGSQQEVEKRGFPKATAAPSTLEQRVTELERAAATYHWTPEPHQPLFVARITGVSNVAPGSNEKTTICKWQEQCFVNGQWADFADGRKSTAFDYTAAIPMGELTAQGVYSPGSNPPQPFVTSPVYIGQIVQMMEIYDPEARTSNTWTSPGTPAPSFRYCFLPIPSVVYVGVGQAESQIGNYTGEFLIPSVTTIPYDPTTGVFLIDPTRTTAPNTVLVVHAKDRSSGNSTNGGHPARDFGTFENGSSAFIGMVCGFTNETVPRPIVLIDTLYPRAAVVNLTVDGGSNGSSSAAASYTYTVKVGTHTTLGTGMTPSKARGLGRVQTSGIGIADLSQGASSSTGFSITLLDACETPLFAAQTVVTSVNFGASTVTTTTILSPT